MEEIRGVNRLRTGKPDHSISNVPVAISSEPSLQALVTLDGAAKRLLEGYISIETLSLIAMEPQDATETSPLLAKSTSTLPDPVLTSNGIPPSEIGAPAQPNEDSEPEEDEESQSNGEDGAHQYQGMPEVRARLWYIVPALGIGVKLPSPLR